MDWTDILGTVLGGVAGYYGADSNKNRSVNIAPWSGVQPYLIGGGTVPGYLTSTPTPTQQWQQWQQGAASGAEGSWLKQPPSMFGNYASPGTYTAGQPMTGSGDVGSNDSSISGIASMAAQLLSSDLGKSLLSSGMDAITPMVDDLFGITSRTTPAPVVDAMSGATTSPYVPYGDTPMLPIGSADYVNAGIPLDAFGADMAGYGTTWGPGAATGLASSGLASSMAGMTEAGLLGELGSLGALPTTTSLTGVLGPIGLALGGISLMNSIFDDTHPYYAAYDNGEYVGRKGPEWERKGGFDPFGNPIGYESFGEWAAAQSLYDNQSDIARQALDPVAKVLSDMGYDQLRLSYQPNNDAGKPGYYKFAMPYTFTSDGKVSVSEIPGGQWGEWSRFFSPGDQSEWDTKALINSTYGPTIGGQEIYARTPEELIAQYIKYVPLPNPNAPLVPTAAPKPTSGVTGDTYYLNNMAGLTGGM